MSYESIKSFEQECKEKDAEIERLKDIIKRFLAYELDEYDMKPEDLEREYVKGLFTRGFWDMMKEAREATSKC